MKIPCDYERREKVTTMCLIRSMPLLAHGSFNSLNVWHVLGAANMHCHEKSHQSVFRAQDILNLDMAMMDLCVSPKIIVCPGRADCQQIRLSQFHPTKLGSKFRIPQRVPAPSCHITCDWHERESSRSLMMCFIKSPTFMLNQKLMLKAYQNRRRKLFSAKLLFSVPRVMRKKSLCCFRCLDCNAICLVEEV